MANIIAQLIQVGLDLTTAFKDVINTNFQNLAQKDVDNYNELKGLIDNKVSTLESTTVYSLQSSVSALINPATIAIFSITDPSSALEVGDRLTSIEFNYVIMNWASVKSAKIVDITTGIPEDVETIIEASGTVTKAVDYTNAVAATRTYKLDLVDGNDKATTSLKTVKWYWATYSGSSASASLDESGIEGLTKTLKSGFTGDYVFTDASGHKYLCYPNELGVATSFKDKSTGFAVDMQPATTISITNVNGVATTYNVHRTTNSFSGAITISVA